MELEWILSVLRFLDYCDVSENASNLRLTRCPELPEYLPFDLDKIIRELRSPDAVGAPITSSDLLFLLGLHLADGTQGRPYFAVNNEEAAIFAYLSEMAPRLRLRLQDVLAPCAGQVQAREALGQRGHAHEAVQGDRVRHARAPRPRWAEHRRSRPRQARAMHSSARRGEDVIDVGQRSVEERKCGASTHWRSSGRATNRSSSIQSCNGPTYDDRESTRPQSRDVQISLTERRSRPTRNRWSGTETGPFRFL